MPGVPVGAMAIGTTENQGHLMARATEYAQDKMEQLLSLSFGDVTTDTRTFPAGNTGGSGLAIGGDACLGPNHVNPGNDAALAKIDSLLVDRLR